MDLDFTHWPIPKALFRATHPVWPWYVLCFFLVVASSFASIKIVLPARPIKEPQKIKPALPTLTESSIKPSTNYRLREVAKWHIFGAPLEAEPEVMLESLPETELELKLVGAFTGSKAYASAIIKPESEDTRRIFIGDSIADGVSLHSVQDAHIVIRRGNALESLSMFELMDDQPPVRPPAMEKANHISTPKIALVERSGFQNTPEAQLEILQKLRKTASTNPGRRQ